MGRKLPRLVLWASAQDFGFIKNVSGNCFSRPLYPGLSRVLPLKDTESSTERLVDTIDPINPHRTNLTDPRLSLGS